MTYEGSCHCGAVTFEVESELPAEAMSCNCSHCRRKGFLWTFLPADRMQLAQGDDALQTYTFYKHKLKHRFCTTCGTQPFADGQSPDGGEMRAINLRCVPDCDLDALQIKQVDGASF